MEKMKLRKTINTETVAVIPSSDDAMALIAMSRIIPMVPPISVTIIASIKNCICI